MHPVTNVSFDRLERQVFERANVWVGLADDDEYASVLRRLTMKDPTGIPYKALCTARNVLSKIVAKALEDLERFLPASLGAPETAPEHSLIANPRMAALMIVQARESALKDTQEALDLVTAALFTATAPVDDMAGV